jgi:probable DNA repair protein
MRRLDDPVVELSELARLGPTEVLVLTVNNRMARTVTAQLAAHVKNGAAELVPIEPWTSWSSNQVLDSLYQSDADGFSQVLDTQTARLIWADVIAHCEAQRSLIDVDQAASLASEADALLLNWHIEVPAAWHTPDYERFLVWRDTYQARLKSLQAIDVARLSEPVARWIAQGRVALPPKVLLMGFTEVSAAMRLVLDAMRSRGVQIGQLVLPENVGSPRLGKIAVASAQQQWHQAIAWARTQLVDQPQGRFAIVVPNLQSQATEARRLLQRDLQGQAFNVAVAPPLANWPLAKALVSWLRVMVEFAHHGEVEPKILGQALLAGGCAGSQTEAGARALVDARWRDRQFLSISLMRWQDDIRQLPELGQAWHQAWGVWQQWHEGPAQSRTWYDWSNRFRAVLAALGFPGQGTQSSVQYQTTAALDQLLSTLAALDDCLPKVSANEAWQMLSRLARQTLFQPQRDRQARLDVLGLLEAEGGRWDGVWVMGVTDDVLPAVVRPNPLIPMQALARAGAPRSTAKRELEWASELMHALQHCAPEVIFSWPERDGEQPKRASPLLHDLPFVQNLAHPEIETLDPLPQALWHDEASLPIQSTETIYGGVSVLQAQAQNPKWSFFQYRLSARGMRSYAQWPSLIDRGHFLHRVMQVLWDRWGDQAHMLKQIGQPDWPDALQKLLTQTAADKLGQWPVALRTLEVHRAISVITAWLAIEAARAPFKVVQREAKHPFRQGELALNLTIDRVDEIADGQMVVIDYKTGASVPQPQKDWLPSVRSDLQLLAYASVLKAQTRLPDALVWAHLHPSKSSMHGVAEESVELPGVKSWSQVKGAALEWSEQTDAWDRQIAGLAMDFAQGHNHNQFWRPSDATYCSIKPLLKLYADIDVEADDA